MNRHLAKLDDGSYVAIGRLPAELHRRVSVATLRLLIDDFGSRQLRTTVRSSTLGASGRIGRR